MTNKEKQIRNSLYFSIQNLKTNLYNNQFDRVSMELKLIWRIVYTDFISEKPFLKQKCAQEMMIISKKMKLLIARAISKEVRKERFSQALKKINEIKIVLIQQLAFLTKHLDEINPKIKIYEDKYGIPHFPKFVCGPKTGE